MVQTLLLTSAGIVPEVRKDFLSLLSVKPSEAKAIFITTAAYGEPPETYRGLEPWWLKRDRQTLYDSGIKNIEDLDLREKNKAQLEKILVDKDIIFVSGGNTFYLLYWTRKSGFDKLIPACLKRGALYVGASAGSYLVCPSIEMALWKKPARDRFGLRDTNGINLVPFLIMAHFVEEYHKLIDKLARVTKYPIVALTDKQALLIKGETIKLLGAPEKNYWNGFKEKNE
ncbi:Type 1 glutamine amidotransferase-like domain-containing protein [Candidatus Woesearchaeota archaeon]|nr:Type 1 glutamine amidotransferase-like domain-containing protein [Candidatus Woesearchaeota archaeon]